MVCLSQGTNEAVNGSSYSGVDHGVLMIILILNLHRTVSNLMHQRRWLGPRPNCGPPNISAQEAVDGYDAVVPRSKQASKRGRWISLEQAGSDALPI